MGADARTFDAIYPALATRHGVPLYPFFLDRVAGDPRLNQPDGMHPTAAGVAAIVTASCRRDLGSRQINPLTPRYKSFVPVAPAQITCSVDVAKLIRLHDDEEDSMPRLFTGLEIPRYCL